jgi:hypothetical protein
MQFVILCFRNNKIADCKYFNGFGKAIGYMLSEECRQNYDSATYVRL